MNISFFCRTAQANDMRFGDLVRETMKVRTITVGEALPLLIEGSVFEGSSQRQGPTRFVEFSVELEIPIEVGDLDGLIAAESEIRQQLQRVLGTDPESSQIRLDLKSLQRKQEILQRLVEEERKRLDAANQKWKSVSSFLRSHGINPDGKEIRFLSSPQKNSLPDQDLSPP
jgi:hypothetical protein